MAVKLTKLQARKINTTPGAVIYFPYVSFIMYSYLYLLCKVHNLISSRAVFLNQWNLTLGGGWDLG